MCDTLSPGQLQFAILFEELYVKPSIRYRCRHLLGQAIDDPSKMARTVLAIMAKPLIGGKPFILRLLPIHLLTAQFLKEHLSTSIRQINKYGGTVVALVGDNHPTNRKCFSLFRDDSQPEPWIGMDAARLSRLRAFFEMHSQQLANGGHWNDCLSASRVRQHHSC